MHPPPSRAPPPWLALDNMDTQIRYQPLEPGVLLAQLLELPYLAWLQTAILLLPPVKRLLGNPQLAGNVRHRRAQFVLLQRRYNLLNRVPFGLI